ncbi:phage major capsid protein, HK97 family [Aromatoleum tolulyticum]|uniref:Phage major capsid protein, HK97 family n=1 Tax=Aromatoleum tolulyticum TaxID=34027 RepID=A0A1N6Q3Y3_9RHOO|nr:phage major capsid protein [Aromatoleum tolulyticum]SIQ11169.1 phage major capsid protein, HK97 family [Aromatoleum tolulyticum]
MKTKLIYGALAAVGALVIMALGADPAAAGVLAMALGTMEVKDLEALQESLKKGLKDLSDRTGRQLDDTTAELKSRLLDVEQALAHRGGSGYSGPLGGSHKAVSDAVLSAPGFAMVASREVPELRVRLDAKSLHIGMKAAVVSQDALVQSGRTEIIGAAQRRRTLRDLLNVRFTDAGSMEFPKASLTNNAGPQYSSPNRENVAKNESSLSFTLGKADAVTVAHWIPASRQVLADAGMLRAFIDGQLLYGLSIEEEDQIMLGDGSGGSMDGLVNQATAYNRTTSGDNGVDVLRRSVTQVQLADGNPTGILLNPADAEDLALLKDSQGRYLEWNEKLVPIVVSNAITAGTFLTGDFAQACDYWVREDALVRISESHSDFFTKNMIAILAELRAMLTVYRPALLVKGAL